MDAQSITYENITERNFGVYSQEEQKKLGGATVTIVGVGCDGGMDAYILTRMGIGNIKLVDFDVNAISNLNRQPASFADKIGEKKVEVAKREFSRFNPCIHIEAIDAKLTEANGKSILCGSDVCIQGIDNVVGRIAFHRAAKELRIPAVTMTGQPPFRSFVSTIMPDGPTYEELFGIDFAKGQKLDGNKGLEEKIHRLKVERARHASEHSGTKGWLESFVSGKSGWGITPERSYITAVYQVNETIRLIIGKKPQAIAPAALISDIDGLEEFGLSRDAKAAILRPPNGKNWDYWLF